jgi:hypothetical protein
VALLEAIGCHSEAADLLSSLSDGDRGEVRAVRLLACARNLERAGRIREAWVPLQGAIKATTCYPTLTAAERLLRRFTEKDSPPVKRHCRIGLLGSVTLAFWVPALRAMCFSFGIEAQIYCGAFQQQHQEILDPGSPLAIFQTI